jgi:hypothetical protein
MFRSNRYAPVAATLALVVSLAGSAAATSIALITGEDVKNGSLSGADVANHSVGAKKLKVHSLTAKYLRRGSVTNRAVKNGTLTVDDLSGDTVTALKGEPGPAGPAGPAGPQGPAGDAIRLAGYVKTDPQPVPDDSQFHTVWSIDFTSTANQAFIVTGAIGFENHDPNCHVAQQVTIDGAPTESVFNGAGLLTFPAGDHTISYEVSSDCPITVPGQEAFLIPFLLP